MKKYGDKIYGNEKTNLTLSEKADAVYSVSDPCVITEHADGTYSMRGIMDRDDMTAEDVNAVLEEMWFEDNAEPIDVKYFDAAVELMDDEIREELHAEGTWTGKESFLREYEWRHFLKFGEIFRV